jgi:hypothetical protein
MIFSKPQPFISAFVDEIDEVLRERDPQRRGSSNKQKYWISFCMMATIMTNSICWAQFERAGLLLQPDQLAQLKRKQPVFTVGSLINRIKVECLVEVIHDILSANDPEQELAKLTDTLIKQFGLMPSKKHMVGRGLGRQEPSSSLKYKAIPMAI